MNDLAIQNIKNYPFYRLPKFLFSVSKYDSICADSKLLFALLLDRYCLSDHDKWQDKDGRVYLLYSIQSAGEILHYGHDKVSRLFTELENSGLIERIKQGLGRASRIYLKSFPESYRFSDVCSAENPKSGMLKISTQDVLKSDTNKTERNNTEYSEINLSIYDYDAMVERIKDNIEYDLLSEIKSPKNPYAYLYSKEDLDEIVAVIADTICSTQPTVRIGKSKYATETVRLRLLKLDSSHIEYVFDQLRESTTKKQNIRAYMLTTLFNAPTTISHYYSALVNSDMYGT